MYSVTRTHIKICGITRPEDAQVAVEAGVDAIGLNFAAASPRRIGTTEARAIATRLANRVQRIGVFLDPSPEAVEAVLAEVPLDVLQFHGDETAAFCARFRLPYMKVIRVSGALDIGAIEAAHPDACCLLLDTYVPGRPGGTGQTFDWSLWPVGARLPLVLAGGLTPDNVRQAVCALRPFGVDVSGGVEGPVKGEKDAGKIRRFVAEVRAADAQTTSPG